MTELEIENGRPYDPTNAPHRAIRDAIAVEPFGLQIDTNWCFTTRWVDDKRYDAGGVFRTDVYCPPSGPPTEHPPATEHVCTVDVQPGDGDDPPNTWRARVVSWMGDPFDDDEMNTTAMIIGECVVAGWTRPRETFPHGFHHVRQAFCGAYDVRFVGVVGDGIAVVDIDDDGGTSRYTVTVKRVNPTRNTESATVDTVVDTRLPWCSFCGYRHERGAVCGSGTKPPTT